ncbi:hypothetical protein B0H16DRAFT_1843041 [Mycena metata]|uniref:MYND-type domain-containing protein n=1 Tax=Mycena metata TaxID=1033252 RepID=A0AAD7GLY6_9AGAR|nr:hypothetical protein B0H16DRAFT_1843041 [Mycena metata]
MNSEAGLNSEPTHAPRARIDGFIIPPGFTLPSLASVRTDAVEAGTAKEMQERPEDYEVVTLIYPNARAVELIAQALPMHLKLALFFNNKLPNLFRFSYFVLDQDVPEDVRDACIWALSMFIRIMEECPESILRAQGHVEPGNDCQKSRSITLLNARGKITSHLLLADRAQKAIPYAKAMVDEELTRGDDMWMQNPYKALVLSQADDQEVAKTLRRAMRGIESVGRPIGASQLIRSRAFVSRALRNIGADDEAKTHESWLATWFRKNPRFMTEREMKYLLLPAGPILNLLGGEKCTKECQKSHWKHHKDECRELFKTQKEMELMALTDPDGAKRATDWSLWCNSNHDANNLGLIHALGLHRDPKRGRTHIMFKKVEYVPTATKLKHKFRIVACGVFLIKDVLRDIETVMRLDLGKGQEIIDDPFYASDGAHANVPFVMFSFGDGVPALLGSGGMTTDSLRGFSYDPDWRRRFNVGAPPGPLMLKSGAKDVEHVF